MMFQSWSNSVLAVVVVAVVVLVAVARVAHTT